MNYDAATAHQVSFAGTIAGMAMAASASILDHATRTVPVVAGLFAQVQVNPNPMVQLVVTLLLSTGNLTVILSFAGLIISKMYADRMHRREHDCTSRISDLTEELASVRAQALHNTTAIGVIAVHTGTSGAVRALTPKPSKPDRKGASPDAR